MSLKYPYQDLGHYRNRGQEFTSSACLCTSTLASITMEQWKGVMRRGLGVRESKRIIELFLSHPSLSYLREFFSDAVNHWKIILVHCSFPGTLYCLQASGALVSEEMALLLMWTALVSQLCLSSSFSARPSVIYALL